MSDLRGSQIYEIELSLIEDDILRNEIEFILDRYVAQSNFTKPASSTGKYHPPFAQGDGGLVRHTKAVVKILTAWENARPSLNWDAVYAAAILHDGWKYNDQSKWSVKNHALAGADAIKFRMSAIEDQVLKDKLKLIGIIILAHMGRFGDEYGDFEAQVKSLPEEALLVHYADILASRTWYGSNDTFVTKEIVDEIKSRVRK